MTKELAIMILSGDTLATTEQTHEAVKMAVEALQERKTGHWVGIDDEPCEVFECDSCGGVYDTCGQWHLPRFCPNCGVKMEGTE